MSKKMCMDDNGRWYEFAEEKKTPVRVEKAPERVAAIDREPEVNSAGEDVSEEELIPSEDMPVKELKLVCKQRGIKVPSTCRSKAQLLELLFPVDL